MNKAEYYTFSGLTEAAFVERKSRFLSAGAGVETEAEAMSFLEGQRALHKEANHHVYAYRIWNKERFSDDREPSGTAGAPILNLLKTEDMMNAIIVVIRYFGGVLLGTGGLTHAYGHSAKLLLGTGKLVKKVRCRKLHIATDYGFLGKLQYFIAQSDVLVVDTRYTGLVDLELVVLEESADSIVRAVTNLANGRIEVSVSDGFYHVYPF